MYNALKLRDTVTDMRTNVHAPWIKDHTLIFGPKNQHMIILNGNDPNRAADLEAPIHMYVYAQWLKASTLTRPRTKKAWSPKIGGNHLELARWSSHLPLRNAVLRTQTQTAMFTCELHG